MAYTNAGDWGQASTLFDRSLASSKNSQTVKVWLDALRAAQGQDSAVKAATQFVKANPESHGAHYGLAYVLADSELETERSRAKMSGEKVFQASLEDNPREGVYWAVYSRWLNLWGDVSAAEQAAKKALAFSPGESVSMIAMAEVYAAQEDFARAQQYTMKAVQSYPFHPGYARLINTFSN